MSKTQRHIKACSDYKKAFEKEHGYLFCECCEVNAFGTPKHSTHHIYFASSYPDHSELHNILNLILLCQECHETMHKNKHNNYFKQLEKERGLKQLFNKI